MSVRKRGNATPRAWFHSSLCSMLGMSSATAERVMETQGDSPLALVRRLERAEARRELADVTLPGASRTKGGREKRLGPALAARVVEFMGFEPPPSPPRVGKKRAGVGKKPPPPRRRFKSGFGAGGDDEEESDF